MKAESSNVVQWHLISSRRHNDFKLCLLWLQFNVHALQLCFKMRHHLAFRKKQDFDFETFDGEKEPTFLCCVRSAQKYNVGNCFRKTALCSVIYVCLNIIHSERLQMKKLCISDLHSPQFWSVLRLTITTQIGLGSLRHRAVAHQ